MSKSGQPLFGTMVESGLRRCSDKAEIGGSNPPGSIKDFAGVV